MKTIIAILLITLMSCSHKVLTYDVNKVNLSESITLDKAPYHQEVISPTRGIKVKVDIKNTSDTARKFIITVKEVE